MKPIFNTMNVEQLKSLIDEWSQLILETYKKVKRDINVKNNVNPSSAASS